ncbi:hypothetical protein ACLMM6_04995 [Xanthomonas campestris pv. incanae]|uniref:hypothetical protein n=1 Tax=Xanthomonas campestris TaxID=339 RepID=UPI003F4D435E
MKVFTMSSIDAITDVASFQLLTPSLTCDRSNGLDRLVNKRQRVVRLAAKARAERRWKNEREQFA